MACDHPNSMCAHNNNIYNNFPITRQPSALNTYYSNAAMHHASCTRGPTLGNLASLREFLGNYRGTIFIVFNSTGMASQCHIVLSYFKGWIWHLGSSWLPSGRQPQHKILSQMKYVSGTGVIGQCSWNQNRGLNTVSSQNCAFAMRIVKIVQPWI